MFGEEAHDKGRVGVQLAKRWLEATTRIDAHWIYPEEAARDKLEYRWADNTTFIFDIGGVFRDGNLASQAFVAEVKNYTTVGGQPKMYTEYLARCYRARVQAAGFTDQFMWITWHPFALKAWTKLTTAAEVRRAVMKHAAKALGATTPHEAEAAIDDELCARIADSLWLVVLSEKHEMLMLSDADRAAVITAQIMRNR